MKMNDMVVFRAPTDECRLRLRTHHLELINRRIAKGGQRGSVITDVDRLYQAAIGIFVSRIFLDITESALGTLVLDGVGELAVFSGGRWKETCERIAKNFPELVIHPESHD